MRPYMTSHHPQKGFSKQTFFGEVIAVFKKMLTLGRYGNNTFS
jgi:hypothetical protein